MPEPTLAALFEIADPTRVTPSAPLKPELVAAAVRARIQSGEVPTPRPVQGPRRVAVRAVKIGLVGAAASAVIASGIITWPNGTHQPSSSAWAVTPQSDHTIAVTIGAGPGTPAIVEQLHKDLLKAGMDVPVYLSSPPHACTTPLRLRVASDSAYPANTPAHPDRLVIKPNSAPSGSTLILVVDAGQPSMFGRFIAGPLPECIPFSDSPDDGGVAPVEVH